MDENLDGIHLDMSELIEKYNGEFHSCSDSIEIQQISLFCQNNRNDYRKPVLMDMINPMFGYAALYPHTQITFEYSPEIAGKVTEEGRKNIEKLSEMLDGIYDERILSKKKKFIKEIEFDEENIDEMKKIFDDVSEIMKRGKS